MGPLCSIGHVYHEMSTGMISAQMWQMHVYHVLPCTYHPNYYGVGPLCMGKLPKYDINRGYIW